MTGMDNSRPSSPEEPPQDLWSSILDSVSSSRSIPAKQILLLGQPSTGKSTLAAALLQKTSTDEVKEDQRLDFALGYDWADVRDDADEGTFASPVSREYRVCACDQLYSRVLVYRYPCKIVCVHSAFCSSIVHRVVAPFSPSAELATSHGGRNRPGLDATLDIS